MTATLRADAAYPAYAVLTNGDTQVTAIAHRAEIDEFISENIRHAANYRYLTKCAQGLGFDSLTDALSALAKSLAATPAAYVHPDVLIGLADPHNDGVGASIYKTDVGGRVPMYTAPPASSGLLAAVKDYAATYLMDEHLDAGKCVDAAHHGAVGALFAAITREERAA